MQALTNVLAKLDGLRAARQLAYKKLVQALADNIEPPLAEVTACLAGVGKSPDDLRRDVTKIETDRAAQRSELKKLLDRTQANVTERERLAAVPNTSFAAAYTREAEAGKTRVAALEKQLAEFDAGLAAIAARGRDLMAA